MSTARPNVVVFVSHDTGRHISPYGVTSVHTPNAERLAAEGILMQQCFCTAPQCSPSRSSIFTGRYPHNNGVLGLTGKKAGWDMNDDEQHAARLFADLGYDTALVGIAHETATPEKRGFQQIFPENNARTSPGAFARWLDGRSGAQPFYAQIGIFETHIPFAHEGCSPDAEAGLEVPPYMVDSEGTRHDLCGLQGSVRRWDEGVGGVMQVLEERGLAENTLLVVTTDHGIAFPRAKCTLFDPGIGVLLMMRWPGGGIAGGRRFPQMLSNIDILPTVLEAVGADVPEQIQGRSFWPLLTGKKYQPREMIFAEQTFHEHYQPVRGLRTERYKYFMFFDQGETFDIPADMRLNRMYSNNVKQLVHSPTHREMENLYDLQADPNEQNNLAGNPDYEEIRLQMSQALSQWMHDTNDPLLNGPVPSPWYRRAVSRLGS